MNKPEPAVATILIASDDPTDAALVKKLLGPEFKQVYISTDPEKAVEDFELRNPNILVLAFNKLEKSERYYLGLYRLCTKIHLHEHRTVILCEKDDVKRVYQLCIKEYFDDYVLFWPMTHDASRLPMAVHHAVRDLPGPDDGSPTAAQFAVQARRLAALETMLDQQMTRGGQRIDVASRAMEQAEMQIDAALDGFSRKIAKGELTDAGNIGNADGLEREISRIRREEIAPRFRTAAESVQPIKQWADEFKKECAPHVESANSLGAMADSILSTVLVVDDDDFQRKAIGTVLASQKYRVIFATGGLEALGLLRKMKPDLILMDIMMPDIDGLEVTRRMKEAPQFADVPVIMLSGKSEGNIVKDCLKAGAIDFVVKPFDRDTLLMKVARSLGGKATA